MLGGTGSQHPTMGKKITTTLLPENISIIPFLSYIAIDKNVKVMDNIVGTVCVKNFSRLDFYAPEGKSVIQIVFHSDYDRWASLKKATDEYNKYKMEVAHHLRTSSFPELMSPVQDFMEH